MKIFILLNLILVFLTVELVSQVSVDCINANEICVKDTVGVYADIYGGKVIEDIQSMCDFQFFTFDSELNSLWYKYTFASAGSFTFDIIPINEIDDIDFVVFKSESNDCNNLESIRCMFSGENVGGQDFGMCLGSTGLSFNSTDLDEGPGCQTGDDNYVAALDVLEGEVIYVWIALFGKDIQEYMIVHDGTANLACEPVSTSREINSNSFELYPNPFSSYLNIELLSSKQPIGTIQVFSLSGIELFEKNVSGNQDVLDLNFLKPGIYLFKFTDESGSTFIEKVIKH